MSTTTDRSAIYQDQLQILEQDLQAARTEFPVLIELGDRSYSFSTWQGEQCSDRLLAYDCETRAIESNDEVPELALATVYGDQGAAYYLHPADLPRFVLMHSQALLRAATMLRFDFWVSAAALQQRSASLRCLVGCSRQWQPADTAQCWA